MESFSARSHRGGAFLWFSFSHPAFVEESWTVDLTMVEIFEDGFIYNVRPLELTVEKNHVGGNWGIPVGPGRGETLFEMKPHRPPAAAVTEQLWQAWQMEYRWRESSEQCLRDVVDVVSPSNRFTHSVLINAWVCEKGLDEGAETERQEMLSSFRGETAK